MANIGLIVHEGRPAAAELARDISQWLITNGHEVRMPPEEAEATRYHHLAVTRNCFAERLDTVVALGGDGSILRAINFISTTEVPILGVDFGRLGYLSEVQPSEARLAIEKVLAGDFKVEDRLLLHVATLANHQQATTTIEHHWALNEAFVERGTASNTISLTVHLDGHMFTTYKADGLIVATPTGSTAYAFSARGPIIDPSHQALLLTPVAPHMLFNRSLVVPPSTQLQITVDGSRPAVLSVDGRRVAELDVGGVVQCSASPHSARFIKFGERPFHQVWKAKFRLTDPPGSL